MINHTDTDNDTDTDTDNDTHNSLFLIIQPVV